MLGRECVELFHLTFLRALATRGEGKQRIALKGGCNLRFYFGSVRYSEDMDLDGQPDGSAEIRRCIARLFERNDLVLDAETIADVARELRA